MVVEGTDDRYRSLTVGQILLQAMQKKLASTDEQQSPVAPMVRVNTDGRTVLSELDLSLALDRARHYEAESGPLAGPPVRADARPALPGPLAGVRL